MSKTDADRRPEQLETTTPDEPSPANLQTPRTTTTVRPTAGRRLTPYNKNRHTGRRALT